MERSIKPDGWAIPLEFVIQVWTQWCCWAGAALEGPPLRMLSVTRKGKPEPNKLRIKRICDPYEERGSDRAGSRLSEPPGHQGPSSYLSLHFCCLWSHHHGSSMAASASDITSLPNKAQWGREHCCPSMVCLKPRIPPG